LLASKLAGGNLTTAGGAAAVSAATAGASTTAAGAAGAMRTKMGLPPTRGLSAPSSAQMAKLPSEEPRGAVDLDKLFTFGDKSGTKQNFQQLTPGLQDAVTNAASAYFASTGKKMQVNSARRDPEDQQRLWDESVEAGRPGKSKTGMPIGKPGTSKHERGEAIDIQNHEDPAAVSAMNQQGLKQTIMPKDPVHFQLSAADGGMFSGPKSGYPATLHGDEAVIPLAGGAVPVKLFQDTGPTFAGMNEYTGYNQGPMSTDLKAIKQIAESLGAFDKASQTITDPKTWKEILNSGIAMNYDLGELGKIGTEIIPNIGIEIGARIKEIQEQHNTDKSTALAAVGEEFRTAMREAFKELEKNTQKNMSGVNDELVVGIRDMISAQKDSVSIQKKLLAVSQ
jgi:hypothetical protein